MNQAHTQSCQLTEESSRRRKPSQALQVHTDSTSSSWQQIRFTTLWVIKAQDLNARPHSRDHTTRLHLQDRTARPHAPGKTISQSSTATTDANPPPQMPPFRPSPRAPRQTTLALLKPSVTSYQPDVSAILRQIKQTRHPHRLEIARTTRVFWTPAQACEFYAEHAGRFYFPRLIAGMTSGPFVAMALSGDDAIRQWRAMLGPTKVYRGKWEEEQPVGLRAAYGIGDTRNGLHGSGECRGRARVSGWTPRLTRASPASRCVASRRRAAQTRLNPPSAN